MPAAIRPPRSRPPGTVQLVSSTAATMPMARFAGPDASLAGTGSRPRASSPGMRRPAGQHRVAAHPASGLNRIGCVMPAHAAGRQLPCGDLGMEGYLLLFSGMS